METNVILKQIKRHLRIFEIGTGSFVIFSDGREVKIIVESTQLGVIQLSIFLPAWHGHTEE